MYDIMYDDGYADLRRLPVVTADMFDSSPLPPDAHPVGIMTARRNIADCDRITLLGGHMAVARMLGPAYTYANARTMCAALDALDDAPVSAAA